MTDYIDQRVRDIEAFERQARGEVPHRYKKADGMFDFIAYQRDWRKANPEKVRRNYAKYINSPKGQEMLKRFYESGAASKSRKKYAKSYRGMLQRVMRRAEIRHCARWPNEPFTLTHAQIIDLWRNQAGLCALSGLEMTWGQGSAKATSVSIDRIDSQRGYHLDNVRLICHAINAFRGNGTDVEMLEMARAIVAWVDNDLPEFSPLRTAATAADVAQPVGEPK